MFSRRVNIQSLEEVVEVVREETLLRRLLYNTPPETPLIEYRRPREKETKMAAESNSIQVSGMQFGYDFQTPLFFDFSLKVSPGSRCLLVGANGSGKTTLLRILAGKHLVGGKDVVRVLNFSAFHDTHLVCSGDLAYLGESWSKNVGSAGEIPLQGDFSAEHMIFGVDGVDPIRREKLIELLDIDLQWRMHKVSDGQRRRVQICMGLLHPYKVLLLDEVTVDLDVVARMDLLDFFKEECEQRGATVVYATHIFDGLETWATDLVYVQDGVLKRSEKLSELAELKTKPNLLSVVETWLRSETPIEKKKASKNPSAVKTTSSPFDASPFRSSRHMAYYR
ncbi:PREDICTED: ABC transporter I family member 21-like [Ipomoea nil]|uniref:ABC transporter I family member 21-like n=1 Tax=Ipomoea nil TaxID=35883 RepID=UPI00090101F1|nr:PREDICTED: ABC transporter I family member 21-like [Ipomoea nil]